MTYCIIHVAVQANLNGHSLNRRAFLNCHLRQELGAGIREIIHIVNLINTIFI